MNSRVFASFSAVGMAIALVSAMHVPLWSQSSPVGSKAGGWTQPKTPWGDPDLQGIWTSDPTSTPMERPLAFGTREFLTVQEIAEKAKVDARIVEGASEEELDGPVRPRDVDNNYGYDAKIVGQEYNRFWTDPGKRQQRPTWPRTSLIVDPPDGQRPPFTRETLSHWEQRLEARRTRGQRDSWLDSYLGERCISGATSITGGTKRFFQVPGYVAVLGDGGDVQMISLDRRHPLRSNLRQWRGDSVGRWEGNTLVVETTNVVPEQNGGAVLPNHGGISGAHTHFYPGTGETLRIIERFTRVGPDRMEYGYTIDDPKTYVSPYTTLRPMSKEADDYLFLERACHEGNYGMPNSLSGACADENTNLQASLDEINARVPALRAEWEKLKKWEASRGSAK